MCIKTLFFSSRIIGFSRNFPLYLSFCERSLFCVHTFCIIFYYFPWFVRGSIGNCCAGATLCFIGVTAHIFRTLYKGVAKVFVTVCRFSMSFGFLIQVPPFWYSDFSFKTPATNFSLLWFWSFKISATVICLFLQLLCCSTGFLVVFHEILCQFPILSGIIQRLCTHISMRP